MSVHRGILILDFGSQYTQLIARRVRELNVYSECHAYDVSAEKIKAFNPIGIILSGGPASVTEFGSPRIPDVVFELNIPVLGICYGMQAMAEQLGGAVVSGLHREYGHAEIEVTAENALLPHQKLNVWMSHGDRVSTLPPEFKVIASTESVPIVAMANEKKKLYALQFHPEVTHTQAGAEILNHFLENICGCQKDWTIANILEEQIVEIREKVGDKRVILGLSGGVDSAVTALLLHRAIGSQLTCIFVDTGLLRQNEATEVVSTFQTGFGLSLQAVEAQSIFLEALKGISDPEDKRKIIGKAFIDVFEHEAKKISNVTFLAQGTIYPDVIESAADGKTVVIKSHHNVGGLPEKMHLQLLEPLRQLFKDEVRKLGLALGLPKALIYRHPFPGPGLGVRILGEIKSEYIPLLQKADAIFLEELHTQGLYDQVSQAFAVFLPVNSVGVLGDARHYAPVIALRAVETIDFMTAQWADLPIAFLRRVSNRIINEVSGISRVVYDISSKPPATIEWE